MPIQSAKNDATTSPVVAVTHWNFGPASRKSEVPIGDASYDPDWYKRDAKSKHCKRQVAPPHSGSDHPIPFHLCVLREREKRASVLHQQYFDYAVRFVRWDKRKGWARYLAQHPVGALIAMVTGKSLPGEWRKQPLSEIDYLAEVLLSRFGSVSKPE